MDQKKLDEYFRVLGLKPTSSFEEVRESYKDLVDVWHPDRFADHPRRRAKAEEKLKEINAAYEELKAFFQVRTSEDKLRKEVIIRETREGRTARSTDVDARNDRLLLRNERIRWLSLLAALCFISAAGVYLIKTRKSASPEISSTTVQPVSLPSTSPELTAPASSPINLEAGLIPSVTPTPKPSPSLEDYLEPSQSPTIPPFDEWQAQRSGSETPTPTSTPSGNPSPRTEVVVSAHDILSIGFQRKEDRRRYRFQLDGIARIKGNFSARGGGVTVRIFSATTSVYVSGFNVSADSIDVALYSGIYELEVTLVGTETAVVSFNVTATAYYNP